MLFTVIPLQAAKSIAIYGDPAGCPCGDWRPQSYQAAQVGIVAFKNTATAVIPLQATRSVAFCCDPARCQGGDWRPQSYQASQVGIAPSKILLLTVIPVQATRSILLTMIPLAAHLEVALKVTRLPRQMGIGTLKVVAIYGDPAPSD